MLLKLLKLFFTLFLLYTLTLFYAPNLFKDKILEIVNQQLNATLSLHSIHINPFTFELELSNLQLLDNKQKSLLSLKNFYANFEPTSLYSKTLHIKKATLSDLNVSATLDKNAQLNFSSLLKTNEKKRESAQESPNLRLLIEKFELINASASFEDKSVKNAPINTITHLNLDIYNIDSLKNSLLNYALSMNVNALAYIHASGVLGHSPLSQRGSLKIANLELKNSNPYLENFSYLALRDGTFNLDIETSYKAEANRVAVSGSTNIEKLSLKDLHDNSKLLSFQKFQLDGIDFKLHENSLNIEKATLTQFLLNAKIYKNKEINLAKLLKNETKTKEPTKDSKEPLKLTLGSFVLENSRTNFYDISKDYRLNIHDINLLINSISNQKDTKSLIQMDAKLDKYSALDFKANTYALEPKKETQFDLNLENMALNSINAYSAKALGYAIDEGKLGVNLSYAINDSMLKASNAIEVKKIKIGKRVEDTNTSPLPLNFIAGMLEDSRGVIALNMPIEGNLDEPSFHFGEVISTTFRNMLLNIAKSPFSLLGSLLGIDASKLSFIAFKPNSSKATVSEIEKLDSLAKIMQERPKISLKITGSYNTLLDVNKTENELNSLALSRAKYIQNYLIKNQKIDTKRVLLDDISNDDETKEKTIKALLEIKVE